MSDGKMRPDSYTYKVHYSMGIHDHTGSEGTLDKNDLTMMSLK